MPHVVAGDDPATLHERMAATLDAVLNDARIQATRVTTRSPHRRGGR